MGLRADPAPQADQLSRVLAVVTVMLSVLFVAWLLSTATAGPPRTVDTITIDNRTGLTVSVEAVGGAGALALGMIEPGGTTARHEIEDLGDTWTFVASYGGDEVARTPPLSRARLAADGWTVRLDPTPATRELRDAGFL